MRAQYKFSFTDTEIWSQAWRSPSQSCKRDQSAQAALTNARLTAEYSADATTWKATACVKFAVYHLHDDSGMRCAFGRCSFI